MFGDTSSTTLQGKRVLVTRTREQASVLSEQLRLRGAIPIEFPTIRIVPPTDWAELDRALTRLYATDASGYDWLILTSVNGVKICMQRLLVLGLQPAALQKHVRIATIGPATAAALNPYGIEVQLMPDEYIAEGIVQALHEDAHIRQVPLSGQRILLARAAEARTVLITELQRAGASVDVVAAYYTKSVTGDDERGREILQMLQAGQLDILTFTSSSTVRNFVTWLKSCAREDVLALLAMVNRNAQLASIGPVTSQTARELGLSIDIEAREFTIDGLVNALVLYEGNHGRPDKYIS